MKFRKICKRAAGRGLMATAGMVALCGTTGTAHAYNIDTGNPDIRMIWGNTVRYNAGWRKHAIDPVIGNFNLNNESDHAFKRNEMVTNRLDLLTELDFSYKTETGFRISAAAWQDFAFRDKVRTGPSAAVAMSSYNGNKYSNYVKRYVGGLSGEILDAYVFSTFNLGGMPGSVKVGRQTVLWGEAIALSAHSVSYAQAPSDGYKALANPGVDAKETALPIGQIAGTLQVADNLSLSGQYYFEWQPTRVPEGGTFLGASDPMVRGPDRYPVGGPLFFSNNGLVRADDKGEWGINARWQPEFLGGGDTLGFYYREFSERTPTISSKVTSPPPALSGYYRFVYPENAKLYGVSLSKNIGGVSVGVELVRRVKTALNAGSLVNDGADEGARGKTTHLLLNGVYLGGATSLWDTSVFTAELAYSRWNKVTSGQKYFNTCDIRPATFNGAGDGCVTKEAWQAFINFGPQWVSVRPGWDLTAGASYMVGIKGNSAVLGGGGEGAGSWGLKLTATYNTKHDFTIAYNGYLATYQKNAAGTMRLLGSTPMSNGAQIQDRDWIAFTYKGSF